MSYTLGFIGAGNMAEAIAAGAVRAKVLTPDQIIAADPVAERREVFSGLDIATTDDSAAVVGDCDQVLLAIKPQTLPQIGAELSRVRADDQIVISIMAGIRSGKIEAAIGRPARIVRVMPNTPLMAGQGMAGVALGVNAKQSDDDLAMQLFGAAGKAIRIDEKELDAITAVSGSGPAYVFYLAEAMEQAASELGLTRDARLLVQQTLLGAATLMLQSDDPPAELRRKVTSPGGTTEAAINHLEGNATRDVFINAIKAAHQRSIELGA